MKEFRNLTPFHSMSWVVEGHRMEEADVVVLRVGYRLVPLGDSAEPRSGLEPPRTSGAAGGATHGCQLLEGADAVELSFEDRYFAEPLTSSVRFESDLAPFKPRCDVLVNATAHAPGAVPAAWWPVRVRLTGPAGDEVLLDKALVVHGPRWFEARGDSWVLGEAEPATEVPVRWEHAYGGTSRLEDPPLHEACFVNPLGQGWIEGRHLDALRRDGQTAPPRWPAPQIEDPRRPITALDVVTHASPIEDHRQMAAAVESYRGAPAGLGAVGRAWTPRLQRAGTYDAEWQEHRWPHLPDDFDFAYWNAAPLDQQIPFPPADLRFELLNLAPASAAPAGLIRAALPGHRALVHLVTKAGVHLAQEMNLDTLLIDAEALTVDVVWRLVVPMPLGVDVIEARFEVDPAAPLLRFEP
jgi:hypothetical protein